MKRRGNRRKRRRRWRRRRFEDAGSKKKRSTSTRSNNGMPPLPPSSTTTLMVAARSASRSTFSLLLEVRRVAASRSTWERTGGGRVEASEGRPLLYLLARIVFSFSKKNEVFFFQKSRFFSGRRPSETKNRTRANSEAKTFQLLSSLSCSALQLSRRPQRQAEQTVHASLYYTKRSLPHARRSGGAQHADVDDEIDDADADLPLDDEDDAFSLARGRVQARSEQL